MKLLLYAALLLAVLLLPNEGTDVGRLIPVEVIAVSEDRGTVKVETDTGDLGKGRTLQEAFVDLKETAPGVIYLDTAEYLLLETGMEERVAVLRTYLKGDVHVCHAQEGIPLEGIANYLSVHKPKVRLDGVSNAAQIPMICEENGRYLLNQK